jgi:pimeloyl-ACP methyl ester carboxylesterase
VSAAPELHVEEHGEGPPLLLITGLGYAVWCWVRQLPAFAERHRTIVFDNRGSGRSFKPPGPYTIELLAADAASVLDERGVGRAHVLGHSMGGYIAQALALRRPDLVERLVLVATSAGGPQSFPQPEATTRAWTAASGLAPEAFARATWPYSWQEGWPEAHAEEYEELFAARLEFPTPPESWAAQYAACLGFIEHDVPAEEIGRPTLVVHGDRDRIVDFRNGEQLARRIPDARLETFTGHGHLPLLEAPERFNACVLEFLAQ